jgi:hypothetical protein
MDVGAADRSLPHFNQQIVVSDRGERDFFHPEAWFGLAFNEGFHHLLLGFEYISFFP